MIDYLETTQLKWKIQGFRVMLEAINQFMASSLIFKLFTFIESLQLVIYNYTIDILYNAPVNRLRIYYYFCSIYQTSDIISVTQLHHLLNGCELDHTYYVFIVQSTTYHNNTNNICRLSDTQEGILKKLYKDKISAFVVYSLKIISFYALLLQTFLSIIFVNIFMVFIYCDSKSNYSLGAECYSGAYLLHNIFGFLGLTLYILLHSYIITLYIDLKPNSDAPFAQPQSQYEYYRFFLKIIIILYITVDNTGNYSSVYLIIMNVAYGFLLFLRIINCPHYNRDVYYFLLYSDSSIFALNLCYCLHKFLDSANSDNVGFYFILLLLPFICNCTTQVFFLKTKYLMRMGIRNLQDASYVEQYFNQLMYLIDGRDDQENLIHLEGELIQHMEFCVSESCLCKQLISKKVKDGADDYTWYKFVLILLEQALAKYPKSARLHLLASYIYKEKLLNKFKCYSEVIHVQTLDPTYREEYSAYRQIHEIEDLMQEEDQKGDQTVDVMKVVKFQKYYGEFQTKLEESVNRHYEFWSELTEHNPDIQKLYNLGASITQSVEDVKDVYQKLTQINPNHINTLKIYGTFQNDVINNENVGPRILEKADQIHKTFTSFSQDSEQDKYGDNSTTCVITCSADVKNQGFILTCNKEINILGYKKHELQGQYITRIMPKCYGNMHDKLMGRFLETNQSKYVGVEREVMCLHKLGYIIPCSIMFKVLPVLTKGIRMVGFIKQLKLDFYYILFDARTFQIFGISENCVIQFGMNPALCFGNNQQTNEFNMESIVKDFKHLVDKLKQKDQQQTTFKLVIDTTQFKQKFLLDQSYERSFDSMNNQELEPEREEEKKKMSPYRVQEVKCVYSINQYEDYDIVLLKFTEEDDLIETGKSLHPSHDKKVGKKTISDSKNSKKQKKNHQTMQKVVQEDFINEDRSSVNSVQSSVNDDLRRLKDQKALMSEKIVPRTIRIIQGSMLMLTFVLLSMAIVDLVLKNQSNEQFRMATQFMSYFHTRNNQLSTVMQYTRQAQLYATGAYYNSTEITRLLTQIQKRVQKCQQLTFLIMNLRVLFDNQNFDMPQFQITNLTQLTQSNFTYDMTLNQVQSIIELQNSMISISNSDLTLFNNTQFITKAQQNFYYVSENGIKQIRQGIVDSLVGYYNNFQDQISLKLYTFLAIMIVSVMILIVTHVIVLPILFNVDKTNNKVLSLFGLIPVEEIKELGQKCEDYLKNHIEDYGEKKDVEKSILNQSSKPPQSNQQEPVHNYIEVNNEDIVDKEQQIQQQFEQEQQLIQQKQEELLQKQKAKEEARQNQQNRGNHHRYDKKDKKKKQNLTIIELTELEKERVEKLESSQKNRDTAALVKFFIFFLLFTGFFIIQLVLINIYLNNIKFVLQHLDLSHLRYTALSYRVVMGIENVVRSTPVVFNGVDLQDYYNNMIYDIERRVFESYKTFPLTGYDTYLGLYQRLNFDDMCANVNLFNSQETTLNTAECVTINNGILQKGLKTSLIDLALYTNQSFQITATQTRNYILNQGPMNTVSKMALYQRPAFSTLNTAYLNDSLSYIDYQASIEIVKFVILIVSWIFFFVIIWTPYLNKLSKQIWQTKGMLNMIPMFLLQKNEKLKHEFLRENIIAMVQ